MTSKELVNDTLKFKNNNRAPRHLWCLPWAENNYQNELENIKNLYPDDICTAEFNLTEKSKVLKGDLYEVGEAVDAFGCNFINYQKGIIGEVKEPLVKDDDWEDANNIIIPEEWLSFEIDEINSSIKNKFNDKFVMAGHYPRPFEQLQFIRGTENLYMDLMFKPKKMIDFIERLHDFYCRLLEKWAKTNVDALYFMDDWGTQKSLLINPKIWDEIFAPMYKDYIEIAKKAGKFIFMHSDGYTMEIIPKLIDMGLDALNTQIFCMGAENLKQYKGKITFWGEIDRQNILPYGSILDVENAVTQIYNNLWQKGGCIAQCEFGIGARPDNVEAVFKQWDKLTGN